MDKPLFKLLILTVIVGALIGAAFTMQSGQKEGPKRALPLLASTEVPNESPETTMLSPDGKKTLTIREKKEEGNITYTLLISDKVDGVQKEIYTKTLTQGDQLIVPYNTFSPDNKYIFLKEEAVNGTNYFVLALSGEGRFDVSNLFVEKFSSDYIINDVTGWGGVNLLIIKTSRVGGGEGSSFWFEVPGASFIRLSHSF